MEQKRITHVRKNGSYIENPHEAITAYKFADGTIMTRQEAVSWLHRGGEAYVQDSSGHIAFCFVNKNRYGTEFLQTKRDGIPSDNLLSLPAF